MEHRSEVRVYRNLTEGNWSIQTKTPRGWRVAGHATSVELLKPTTKVSEAGRQRVLRERCKNVHSYIIGFLDLRNMDGFPYGDADRISYNPYKAGTFTTSDGEPVTSARRVRMNPNGTVYAIDIKRGLQSTQQKEATS